MASQFKLLPFILFIAVVFCSACNEAPKQMGMPPAVVSIEPVRVGPFKEKSDYLGNVTSRTSIPLSPNVEGHITSIEVTAGQTVPAGARIMRIDSRMQAAQTDAIGSAADSVRSDLSNAEATLR
ncbi:MAG TPA: efflux RND transporter periplasmic adaptor subunit, partial [Candidatus Melainabacteria bacterium]|nr:efflux RND transporter periplasmic adaptor subunit [Candidatus Melainabacteria bacterium]